MRDHSIHFVAALSYPNKINGMIISTYNHTIYLIGVAQSRNEMDRVVAHAREVRYVRKLVNYVLLSKDPRRAQ